MTTFRSTQARALVAAAGLLALGAHAVPHQFNAPFLLKDPVGTCAVAIIDPKLQSNVLARAPCDPQSPDQKFYVLNDTTDNDFTVPVMPGESRVRIVSGPFFDVQPTVADPQSLAPNYWMFMTDTSTGLVSLRSFYVGGGPRPGTGSIYRLKRPPLPTSASTWTTIANQGEYFPVVGKRQVRYGVGIKFVTKLVSGTTLPQQRGLCDVSFFGRDPARDEVKHCEILNDQVSTGPFTLILEVVGNNNWCVTPMNPIPPNPPGYSGLPCWNPEQTWTLIPLTSYPQ